MAWPLRTCRVDAAAFHVDRNVRGVFALMIDIDAVPLAPFVVMLVSATVTSTSPVVVPRRQA